jgi:hypothetical protein
MDFNLCLHRYKLTFYAADGTVEAEMFCFDTIAKQIVGKSCEFLLRTLDASQSTPKDLRAIVGLKFTFAVNININSYYSKQRILNVNSVLQAHGREEQQTDSNRDAAEGSSFAIDDCPLRSATEDSPATAMKKLSTSPDTSLVSTMLHILMESTPIACVALLIYLYIHKYKPQVRRSLTFSPRKHSFTRYRLDD